MQQFETFIALIRDAKEFSSKCVGVNEYEFKFIAVLEFIKKHPDLRPKIVEEFANLLKDRTYGHYHLIEFCRHELKWSEMRAEAEKIFAAFTEEVVRKKLHGTPSQHLSYLENVLSSFDETWEDGDLFDYYADESHMSLLEVQNLKVHFPVKHGVFSRARLGVREFFLDGGDVKRIQRVDAVAFADHHYDILAHRDEFRMRHRKHPPAGQADRERLETVDDQLADALNVHRETGTLKPMRCQLMKITNP